MAKNKYETHVLPKLVLVECWVRDGLSEMQIAEMLGISKDTFYRYKKEYPAFLNALNKSGDLVDNEVEDALLDRAKGGIKTIRKPIKLKHVLYDCGKKVEEREYIEYVECEEYYPPDIRANIFWLKNRRPDRWKDKQEIEAGDDLNLGIVKIPEVAALEDGEDI